jgi:hypothetical protein
MDSVVQFLLDAVPVREFQREAFGRLPSGRGTVLPVF